MKGLVVDCLKEVVEKHFEKGTWKKILTKSDVSTDKVYGMMDDIEDEMILKLFGNTCEIGGTSFEQACDAFGDYWVEGYTQKHWPEFYNGIHSTREFLEKLNSIHDKMRVRVDKANPPKLSYSWKDDNTMIMVYDSYRDLTELFAGAVRGVAKYFKDKVEVLVLDRKNVEIKFL